MSTNIFRDGILVDVNVRYWSGARALTPEDLGLKDEEVPEAFKLGRKYLIPERIVKEWRKVESRARSVVENNSFPFPIGNARFITKKRFQKVVDRLNECQAQFSGLVEDLSQNYESYKTEMAPVYIKAAETAFINSQPATSEFGPDYDPDKAKKDFVDNFMARLATFYPTTDQIRGSFSLTWDVYAISMPRMRQTTDETLIENEKKLEIAEEEYQKQMQQKMSSFVDDVVKTLRQETLTLCNHITQNIKDGKVVSGNSINSVRNFIDKFESMNFVGDSTIEAQLASLRKDFLDVTETEKINEDVDTMEEFKRRISLVAEAAASITDISSVTGEYKRRIQWTDDPIAEAA